MKKIIILIVALAAAFAISSCTKEQSFDYIYSIEMLDSGYSVTFNQIGWPAISESLTAAGFREVDGTGMFTKKGPKSKMDSEITAAVQKGVDAQAGNALLQGCKVKIKNINDQSYIAEIIYK